MREKRENKKRKYRCENNSESLFEERLKWCRKSKKDDDSNKTRIHTQVLD